MRRVLSDILPRFLLLLVTSCFVQCSAIKDLPKYQLQDDYYQFRQTGQKPKKVFVYVEEDTLQVVDLRGEPLKIELAKDEYFVKKSFDLDVLTVPFKYRPSSLGFPRQLNSNINGNVMLGYRIDQFQRQFKQGPTGLRKTLKHRGLAVGAFGGFGSTFVSPWTTNLQITDEYDGVVVTRGLTLLLAVNSLTVGLGIGWDYLTDRNKNTWIYQNKPWYGLTLGLNLN